jgi:hypothetical protein
MTAGIATTSERNFAYFQFNDRIIVYDSSRIDEEGVKNELQTKVGETEGEPPGVLSSFSKDTPISVILQLIDQLAKE